MILGILAKQFGLGFGGGGGSGARHWRLYFTGMTTQASYMNAGDIEMAETIGGIDVTGVGTASASSEAFGTTPAADAFDGDGTTYWMSEGGGQIPSWLAYDFGAGVGVDITELRVTAYDDLIAEPAGDMFATALVQSSDDGVSWVTQWVIPPQAGWDMAVARSCNSSAGLRELFVSDAQRQNPTTATDTTTFAAMDFGPERTDRLVAVAVMANRQAPISGVTIGGTAATLAVRSKDATSSAPFVEIWYARPTGTAGDVVVTHGASETGFIRAVAWNIGSVATATPSDTDRLDDGVSGDMSIVAPSGSVVIAVPCGGFSNVALSGLAESFIINLTNASFNGIAQEIVATGATKTITTSAAEARVAACWAI